MSKILLIEDNKNNALLIRRLLESRKHDVLLAQDGESGLELAETSNPDLILLDLGLPDIDGQTLVTFLRQKPQLEHIPIVAVTAWPPETARQMALAYGCNGYISKPISARTFPDEVAEYLPKP